MRLYKYFHPDRTDVLQNETIRFSSPKVLNDPFELKPYISEIAPKSELESGFELNLPELLSEKYAALSRPERRRVSWEQFQVIAKAQLPVAYIHLKDTSDQMLAVLQSSMENTFEKMIGILCLTESPDNLLMWAHYAHSHQGFVVEFDTDHPFFDQRLHLEDDFRCLRKVIYSEKRPSFVLSNLKDFTPFLTKGLEWSYETEWRMMLHLESASTVHGEGPAAVHLFNFPKSSIRRVILGCRVSDAKAAEIRQILKDSEEYANVVCQQAQIDASKYSLNFST